MSEPKDPERLLADALRAHAVFAPQVQTPAPAAEPEQGASSGTQGSGAHGVVPGAQGTQGTEAVPTTQLDAPAELPSAYGLLSGASADSLERERAALDLADAAATSPVRGDSRQPEPATVRGQPVPASASLPAYWVLLLAVLLGLAAGSVVGLLTLV